MADAASESATKYIIREINTLQKEKLHGITLLLKEENLSQIEAEIIGPEETPYEGGMFTIRLVFGPDFPSSPPKGYFLTKIFHPNVSSKGDICVNTLSKDWHKESGLKHLLVVIRCLLIEPNPESALNMEAGHLLLENYEEFCKRARLFTQVHARSSKDEAPRSQESTKENVTSSEHKSCSTNSDKPTISPPHVVSQSQPKGPFTSKNDNSSSATGGHVVNSPKKKQEKKSLKRF